MIATLRTLILIGTAFTLHACAGSPKVKTEPGNEIVPAKTVSDRLIEYSPDCHVWEKRGPTQAPLTGYVRASNTTVYVDTETRFFGNVSAAAGPLYVDAREERFSYSVTPAGFRSIELTESDGDGGRDGGRDQTAFKTVADLIERSERQSDNSMKETEWSPLFIGERTKLLAVLQGETCASAPAATYITCEISPLSCSLFPVGDASSDAKTVSSCLNELKLNVETKFESLMNACAYFSSSTYEENLRTLESRALVCGVEPVRKLPNVSRIESACAALSNAALELQRANQSLSPSAN